MLKWPEKIESQITGLDIQYKKLAALLDKLCAVIKAQEPDKDLANELLGQLAEYEIQYFADEKRLIQEIDIHEKLATLQHMQHCSIVYDIEKIRDYFVPEVDILQPEKPEIVPHSQLLKDLLKMRHQYDKRNAHFKKQLAQCLIESQLTECLHKNIATHFKSKP